MIEGPSRFYAVSLQKLEPSAGLKHHIKLTLNLASPGPVLRKSRAPLFKGQKNMKETNNTTITVGRKLPSMLSRQVPTPLLILIFPAG
jgi:hypothetical protein